VEKTMKRLMLAMVLSMLVCQPVLACGERGGPGCRLSNGKCASWAQASKCVDRGTTGRGDARVTKGAQKSGKSRGR